MFDADRLRPLEDEDPTAEGRTGRTDIRRAGQWDPRVPALFVVLSLLALLVVPLIVQSHIRELSEEIQVAVDPARTATSDIQYLLARQTSALRGYWISGESTYLRQFEEFAEEEEEMYEFLDSLAPRLGSDVVAALARLQERSRHWHEILGQQLDGSGPERNIPGEVPFERDEYLAAIDAATRFEAELASAAQERHSAIRAAEDRMLLIQIGLVVIALLAAVMTTRLGLGMRRHAAAAEARRHEAEVALERSAKAVRSKERLIRGVTHDVKNPLGAADGYAELLEAGMAGPLTPEQARMVTGIRRSIHGGLSIIDDLLEMAGAEGGSLAINPAVVSLSEVVEKCVQEYRGAADAAGHSLVLDLETPDVRVRTDPARVEQIVGNLLSNAIKYTPPESTIRVEVEWPRSGDAGRFAFVRVIDDGRGIPPEHHERIFEEFERLPEAEPRGHGLGLAIARRIARLLGGDLWVESDGRNGSVFSLRLPALGAEVPGEGLPGV